MGDRHADLADLAPGEGMIAVVPGLGREIESDGEAGLTFAEVVAVELVRRLRGRMTGVGAEDPGLVALPPGAVRWLAHMPASPGLVARPRDGAMQHTTVKVASVFSSPGSVQTCLRART